MKTPYALTPGASQGNAFSRHLNGVPSIFCTPMLIAAAAKSSAMTTMVEKNRKAGNDIGLISGLSAHASTLNAQYKAGKRKAA